MFNSAIYKSYDIRGVVPQEFDPAEAYHIGRAYAQHTGARTVVVARDMRPSGELILPELLRGLTEAGVDVIDIELATTPLFYFAVHHTGADGGLMVTASHNPAQYNGIKMTRQQAIPVGLDSGLAAIRELVRKRRWSPVGRTGTVRRLEVSKAYLNLVTQGVDARGFTIVADAGNGMAGLLLPEYFKRVGGTAVPLYWELDGTFPHHEADPLKEENLRDLQQAVCERTADFGVAFDGDADRIFFVTEQGMVVPGDITTALVAKEIIREQPGALILYNVSASRATREVIEEAGGRAEMTKVGHSNIKAHMRRTGAVFAGETSGHFFFTPWYAESALLTLGYVLRLLREQGKPLSELVAPMMRYAKTPEINFRVRDKEAVLARIRAGYADAQILELDGVSVIYPTWWANVRPSNTEPLLRLNLEANTLELLEEKRKELEAFIQTG